MVGKQKNVKVIVLRTAGTNCDSETAQSFRNFGAKVDLVHINSLFKKAVSLNDYHIMAIPGGFSYGDDIISGKILANELKFKLGDDIKRFIEDGKLIIGICNGFQVLVRAGILPGQLNGEAFGEQTVTLTYNDSGKFEDRWTYLKLSGNSPWTSDVDEVVYIPVAHGEGKFVSGNDDTLKKIKNNGQVIFRYCSKEGNSSNYPENPNGSVDDIAGISDSTGRVLGLMPHPERHFYFTQHPFWTRFEKKKQYGHGAKIFENGINYVKENLL